MIKKLYSITIAHEDENAYSPNMARVNVLAETALEAMGKVILNEGEFVDTVENLGVVDQEGGKR